MSNDIKKHWPIAAVVSGFIATLVGMANLGFTMPWQAPTRVEVESKYVTKEQFDALSREIRAQHREVMELLNNRLPKK